MLLGTAGDLSASSSWDSGVFVGQESADRVLSVVLEVRAVCGHKPFLVLCHLSPAPSVSMEWDGAGFVLLESYKDSSECCVDVSPAPRDFPG